MNVGKVWLKKDGVEVLVGAKEVREGDEVVVHMGNVIPFDGVVVTDGEAMVNQASLTGESSRYAGSVRIMSMQEP